MNTRVLALGNSTIGRANNVPQQILLNLMDRTPSLAVSVLMRRMLTPWKRVAPLEVADALVVEDVRVRGHRVRTALWGQGPLVVLTHGWSGGGSQLDELRRALTAQGFSVAVFDAPAHGGSGGQMTNAAEISGIVARIVERWGPVHALVGHSLGGFATALATARGVVPSAVALLAPLPSFDFAVDEYQQAVGFSDALRTRLTQRVREITQTTASELSVAGALPDSVHTLVVHDALDRRVPVSFSRDLTAGRPTAHYFETSGLGHKGILTDPRVVSRVVSFIESAPVAPVSPLDRALQALPGFEF